MYGSEGPCTQDHRIAPAPGVPHYTAGPLLNGRGPAAPLAMIEAHWLLFLLASVVVIATPGQDMILVMSRSFTHGTRALSGGFQSRPRALVWLYRGSGLVMVGLALRLALARRVEA